MHAVGLSFGTQLTQPCGAPTLSILVPWFIKACSMVDDYYLFKMNRLSVFTFPISMNTTVCGRWSGVCLCLWLSLEAKSALDNY